MSAMNLFCYFCRRGHVCMIPGSNEFFIAAIDHKEWGTAHTVWGVVSAFADSWYLDAWSVCMLELQGSLIKWHN